MHDALDMPILDCALPLRASLLYENGLPVKQARLSPLRRDAIRGEGLQSCSSHCLRAVPPTRCLPLARRRPPRRNRSSSVRRTSSRCKVDARP